VTNTFGQTHIPITSTPADISKMGSSASSFCQSIRQKQVAHTFILEENNSMSDNYDQAQERMRDETNEAIRRRFDQLNGVVLETATDGLKFLNLIQLAGMAGILGFIGATKTSNPFLSTAFACFFAGVVCVALTYLYRYRHFGGLLAKYLGDVRAMHGGVNNMTWGKVIANDQQRTSGHIDFGLIPAILSLLLFIGGGAYGYFGVTEYTKSMVMSTTAPAVAVKK
jgi:hypothetical protein